MSALSKRLARAEDLARARLRSRLVAIRSVAQGRVSRIFDMLTVDQLRELADATPGAMPTWVHDVFTEDPANAQIDQEFRNLAARYALLGGDVDAIIRK